MANKTVERAIKKFASALTQKGIMNTISAINCGAELKVFPQHLPYKSEYRSEYRVA